MMRTRIMWLSIGSALGGIIAALMVLCLWQNDLSVVSLLLAGFMGIIVSAMLSLWAGKTAINLEIDSMLKVRDMIRHLNEDGNLEEIIPKDYELLHPIKFIFRELQTAHQSLTLLKTEALKHQHLFDSLEEGLIISDKSQQIMFINDAAKTMFNAPENQRALTLQYVLLNPSAQELLRKVTDGHIPLAEEVITGKKNTFLHVMMSQVRNKNKESEGLIIFAKDITERVKAERMREDFVANVSHELKTPLTSIRGFSELLQSGMVKNETEQHKYLQMIEIETDRLIALINDILQLSELTSLKMDEGKIPMDISQVVQEVVLFLSPLAKNKGVSLHVNANAIQVQMNPQRAHELVMNLVDNAIKYNRPQGQVDIRVFEEKNEAILSISDTGIGIPQKDADRVFERFYRVDKSRSRQSGGTGLGLSIVKHIVSLYNGNIHLESTEDKGTTITIRLPKI